MDDDIRSGEFDDGDGMIPRKVSGREDEIPEEDIDVEDDGEEEEEEV